MTELIKKCRFCPRKPDRFANTVNNIWAQEFAVCLRPDCMGKAKYLMKEYSPINHESKEKFCEMQKKYLIKE